MWKGLCQHQVFAHDLYLEFLPTIQVQFTHCMALLWAPSPHRLQWWAATDRTLPHEHLKDALWNTVEYQTDLSFTFSGCFLTQTQDQTSPLLTKEFPFFSDLEDLVSFLKLEDTPVFLSVSDPLSCACILNTNSTKSRSSPSYSLLHLQHLE